MYYMSSREITQAIRAIRLSTSRYGSDQQAFDDFERIEESALKIQELLASDDRIDWFMQMPHEWRDELYSELQSLTGLITAGYAVQRVFGTDSVSKIMPAVQEAAELISKRLEEVM